MAGQRGRLADGGLNAHVHMELQSGVPGHLWGFALTLLASTFPRECDNKEQIKSENKSKSESEREQTTENMNYIFIL